MLGFHAASFGDAETPALSTEESPKDLGKGNAAMDLSREVRHQATRRCGDSTHWHSEVASS